MQTASPLPARIVRDGRHRLGYRHQLFWYPDEESVVTVEEKTARKLKGCLPRPRSWILHHVERSDCPQELNVHGLESTSQHLHRKRVDTINYDNPQSRDKSFSTMCAFENSILELSPLSDAAAMIRGWGHGHGRFDKIIEEEHLHRLILEIAPRKSEKEYVDSRSVKRKKKHELSVASQASGAPAATPDSSKAAEPRLVGEETLSAYRNAVNRMHQCFGDSPRIRAAKPASSSTLSNILAEVASVSATSTTPTFALEGLEAVYLACFAMAASGWSDQFWTPFLMT